MDKLYNVDNIDYFVVAFKPQECMLIRFTKITKINVKVLKISRILRRFNISGPSKSLIKISWRYLAF